MAIKKFRKIIPAHAVTALDKYLEQVSAFINYVEIVVNYHGDNLPDKAKTTLEEYIQELKSYDE